LNQIWLPNREADVQDQSKRKIILKT